ncbi:8317_t:CDS:2 [Paraglomus brasilianum]|uniref:8317_t:CDS:1 n=1 Tax=Paraglomus brasilianum TaxID=144538 RepID=A0A9N8YWY7_9GLOM|nr:8317_t:CDS:2 [Paraglomus brasilianum]
MCTLAVLFLNYAPYTNHYADIASSITASLSYVPTLEKLPEALQQPFEIPIPIENDVYQAIQSRILNIEKWFVSSMTSGYHAGRLSRTVASVFEMDVFHGTEMFQTKMIDHCIDDVGKDKKAYHDIEQARNELTNKMNLWSPSLYGQLPYLFGYASAAEFIQFFALHPRNEYGTSKTTIQSTPISSYLALNNTVGMHKVLSCVINMVRIIGALEPFFPLQPIRIGHIEHCNYGNNCFGKVQFFDTYVIKSISNFTAYKFTTKDVLNKVYRQTKYAGGIIHAQEAPKFEHNRYKVVLEPLGLSVKPTTESELKVAIKCILLGLNAIHKADLVHRDIRWSNVIQVPENDWQLIDLEHSGKARGEPGFLLQWWAPEMIDEYQRYNQAADIYMVGKLMDTCNVILSENAMVFRDKLTDVNPKRRLTAEAAFNTLW